MRPRLGRVALFVIVLVATFALVRAWDFVLPSFGARYQAVFLANGQTYFGHYIDRLGPYVKVENAFYIQQAPTAEEGQTPESRIIRRGSELHQPVDTMYIRRDRVLAIERVTAGSPIGLAIAGQRALDRGTK